MSAKNIWAHALTKTLNDTRNHIISSELAVVIGDKFPKAKQHYLVLSKDDIPTIFDLKLEHLDLLEDMHLLATNVIEVKQQQTTDFKIGFHAEPSMLRLHLHVISKDFISDSLKTKKHWNSFNTAYFRPYEDIYKELKLNGTIQCFDKEVLHRLLSTDLICNQCDFVAKNIPKLKEHLLEHWRDKYHENVQ